MCVTDLNKLDGKGSLPTEPVQWRPHESMTASLCVDLKITQKLLDTCRKISEDFADRAAPRVLDIVRLPDSQA